jgi:hypothetical protein
MHFSCQISGSGSGAKDESVAAKLMAGAKALADAEASLTEWDKVASPTSLNPKP